MISTSEGYTRLEYFSLNVAADSRRKEFDIKNHSLRYEKKCPDFLFIGDSITHYWELNSYFHQNNCLIVNRGIGGDTTTYLRKRFYVDAIQLQPKYCILGIGINDSIDLEGDYWKRLEPKPYEEVVTTAKDNFTDIIYQAETRNMELILTSILPIDMPVSLHEDTRMQYIKDINCWIERVAKEKSMIYIDYYRELVNPDTGKIKDGTTYDGLHPNAVGYSIMVRTLRDTLKKNNIFI